MANEFITRNGLISQNNSVVTGSLIVTAGITGSLEGTASYAITASYALNGGGGASFPYTGSAQITGSLSVTGSTTSTSFIKTQGTSDQYLKADGSVSTALNSRIENNFIATLNQTVFPLTYEVGQLEIYYNGAKLYPDEFTATNGTSFTLSEGASDGAQISTVKYIAALSTAAIRNETTFSTTLNQTTFTVNYTVGQVDVFYNGSKLNVSEFTATNGTSVVLGFACAAGESIAIISYVNQVSGASGTPNYIAKFTGAAALGNSQIFDNGTSVGIGVTTPNLKLSVLGSSSAPASSGATQNGVLRLSGGTGLFNVLDFGINETNDYSWIQSTRANNLSVYDKLVLQPLGGNVGIGTPSPSTKLDVVGTITSLNGSNGRFNIGSLTNYLYGDSSSNIILGNSGGDRLTINASGAATFSSSVTATKINAPQEALAYNNGTTFISNYNSLPNNSSKSFIIYNASDSPIPSSGLYTVSMIKWDGNYGSMTAINCEPSTQKLYVKTIYGGNWSGWVEK